MVNTRAVLVAVLKAFYRAGVAVHPVGVAQSPVAITLRFQLKRATPAQVQLALGAGRIVESALHVGGVQVRWDAGCIVIEVPLPGAVIYASALHCNGLAMPVGLAMQGGPVYVDFIANPHLLVLGPTNCGKTTMIKGMLYHLRDYQVAIAALKQFDWVDVEGAKLLHQIDEIQAFSLWLRGEVMRRTQTGERTPLFYVVDDAFNLMSQGDLYLDEIASIGRGVGVHLIIVSQRPGEGVGGPLVSSNITARIVFRTSSAADSAFFTGRAGTGAERLKRYHALLITPDDERQFKTACLRDSDVVRVLSPSYLPSCQAVHSAPVMVRASEEGKKEEKIVAWLRDNPGGRQVDMLREFEAQGIQVTSGYVSKVWRKYAEAG